MSIGADQPFETGPAGRMLILSAAHPDHSLLQTPLTKMGTPGRSEEARHQGIEWAEPHGPSAALDGNAVITGPHPHDPAVAAGDGRIRVERHRPVEQPPGRVDVAVHQ